jgi:hypothetical protein
VDPVPDPLLFLSGSARNRTRASGSVAKNPDHKTTEAYIIRDYKEAENARSLFRGVEQVQNTAPTPPWTLRPGIDTSVKWRIIYDVYLAGRNVAAWQKVARESVETAGSKLSRNVFFWVTSAMKISLLSSGIRLCTMTVSYQR